MMRSGNCLCAASAVETGCGIGADSGETSGNTLDVREFYVGDMSTEVTMARLNRDDYTNLPNKNFTANQPYQYWLNRTIPQATITLWPAPSDPFVQMTIWYSRQIMDVGDLNGQLEIPQRWNQAIQFMLADSVTELWAARLITYRSAEAIDAGKRNQHEQDSGRSG